MSHKHWERFQEYALVQGDALSRRTLPNTPSEPPGIPLELGYGED